MPKRYNVAIVGATGIVGSTMLSILEERQFPIDHLYLLASGRSAGETRRYHNENVTVSDLAQFDFSQTNISFFCAGNDITAQYAPIATAAGNVVIDKSSYYRNDSDVPLVVPEVNPHAIGDYRKKNIIANPNCSTIPIVVALKPIYDAVGITKVNVVTYQSVSGAGKEAMNELSKQTAAILQGQSVDAHIFPQQIAFNVLPHIDTLLDNGYTREEMKIVWEMRKILEDDTLAINPTAVRVPVYCGHSAAVHFETRDKLSLNHALELLGKAPGVEVISGSFPYPTPAKHVSQSTYATQSGQPPQDKVYVGRLREDISSQNGLNLWVVADNLRKGAALNGVQVAEKLISSHLS